MPASIAHMLIAQDVRQALRQTHTLNDFLDGVLDKYPTFMELGALGPDLPYFGGLLSGFYNTFVCKSDKPMGVDQWSYQLHSKQPNVFPLKMIEITWKETSLKTDQWEDNDRKKFAFLCGFLTHMAADQIIHPVVNRIAGFYYKKRTARDRHRTCEVHQDLYALARHRQKPLTVREFTSIDFGSWCGTGSEALWISEAMWFKYFIQKAFVEAHAVTPETAEVANWIKGTVTTLTHLIHIGPWGPWGLLGPYGTAHKTLFDPAGKLRTDTDEYGDFIALQGQPDGRAYDAFFADAVALACVYVRAAHKVYTADGVDDHLRRHFLNVVQNADLGAPLEDNILQRATEALSQW